MKRFYHFLLIKSFLILAVFNANAQCNSPHNTIMAQNNGQDGNMFNVTALTDITIDSVWCNFAAGTMQEVEIWYRPGTVCGFQNSAAGWILIDSVLNLTSAGINNFTQVPIHINLPVAANTTVGLYVTNAQGTGPIMRYTNGPFGSTACNLYNANADVQISYAYGKDYPFGATFNPRIWNGRLFYSCCPSPPAPQGPISGDTTVCIGDTVTYSVPWDSLAVTYNWTVPAGDSIVSGQGDSLIQLVIGPNSIGGQICVEYDDTCATSPDTCITYSIDQPATPGPIQGANELCQNNSTFYSIPTNPSYLSYTWTVPGGASIVGTQDTNMIEVQFAGSGGKVCVQVTDQCATSDTTCLNVQISSSPSLANAGPDRTICSGKQASLNAGAPVIGSGVWTVIAAPGPGVFSDTTDHQSTYTSTSPGIHLLRWTTQSPGCPPTSDIMQVEVLITPTAGFSVSNVCEGSPVGFQDESVANGSTINSWLWDVNGNGVDNYVTQSPSHNYSNSGIYNVRLIVSAQGCADTLYKDVYVNPAPDLDITVDNECHQEAAFFSNSSSISLGSIDSIAWDFDDGSAVDESTIPQLNFQPNYTYADPGSYVVTVTAVSDSGCSATGNVPVTIYHNPVAEFSADNSCQFQTTSFSDNSSVIGSILEEWNWHFGVGSDSAHVKNPEYDYEVNGFVPVTLEVMSEQGCVDDTTVSIEVFPTPVTEFNFTNKVCLGELLDLDQQSSIAYGNIVDFTWTIRDTVNNDSFIYGGPQATHLFDEIGWYTVALESESDQGCKSRLEKLVPVYEMPRADFKYENQCEDVTIAFRDSTEFGGAIRTYDWEFGDGNTSMEQYPVHSYDTFGLYNVQLTVESFKGCIDSVSFPVDVFERMKPMFGVNPDTGCSPFYVQFMDSSLNQTDRELTYVWHYGDGFSRKDTSEYIYTNYSGKVKSYSVTLEIQSDQGCLSSITMDSAVTVLPQPVAAFASVPDLETETVVTTKPLVQFQTKSIQTNWHRWTFGDGASSTEQNPAHEYREEGDYEVTLVARNIFQCADTTRKMAIVRHANIPFIPSAFTPNGDGKNDLFFVEGLQNVSDFKMEIYDRWGQLIFSGDGLDTRWDGTNNQRKIIHQGLYLYRVTYVDNETGEDFELEGNVTVIGVEE